MFWRLFIPILGFVVISTSAVYAQRSEPSATLLELWQDANSRCRGGSGDVPATEAACSERERLGSRLGALERCYGKRGQSGSQMSWHVCSSDSIRTAAPNCMIADPTSTPLNVRTAPNGKLLGNIVNGERVTILDQSEDRTGDRWVYIADADAKPLGWVFRRFVVCK
jgi:hypothetical protein